MPRAVPEGGILLSESWKLVPLDSRNWELCELRATADNERSRASGNVGAKRWHRCERYYSYNTITEAIRYAADNELKRCHETEAVGLRDALRELEAMYERMAARVAAVVRG